MWPWGRFDHRHKNSPLGDDWAKRCNRSPAWKTQHYSDKRRAGWFHSLYFELSQLQIIWLEWIPGLWGSLHLVSLLGLPTALWFHVNHRRLSFLLSSLLVTFFLLCSHHSPTVLPFLCNISPNPIHTMIPFFPLRKIKILLLFKNKLWYPFKPQIKFISNSKIIFYFSEGQESLIFRSFLIRRGTICNFFPNMSEKGK